VGFDDDDDEDDEDGKMICGGDDDKVGFDVDVMGSHVKSFCGDDRVGLDDTVGGDENVMVPADDAKMV